MPPAIYLAALSRYHSYLNSSKQLLQEYNGKETFASYLKKSFSANKKYGSKDRKEISHLCYCYFRLGKAGVSLTIEERILTGLFLCSDQSNEILSIIKPEWNEKVQLPLHEKLLIINYSSKEYLRTLLITNVFPWNNELTYGIDHEKFCESFFIQPDLFLRIRPGKKEIVLKKLEMSGCGFRIVGENSIAIPNSTRVESILEPDRDVMIQDYNSQETGRFISNVLSSIPNDKPAVWDCCAGSGGKSIMAYDINPDLSLTVSDVRESILINLKKRFTKAGIRNYESLAIDLVSDKSKISNLKSKIIICDAPCTGSGTWSRTPEQLYFFNESEIEKFASLQRKIVSNVIPQLQHGGSLIYITCSVFKKENEDLVEFMRQNFDLELRQMEVLKGYDKKADSMFVAVLKKPNH